MERFVDNTLASQIHRLIKPDQRPVFAAFGIALANKQDTIAQALALVCGMHCVGAAAAGGVLLDDSQLPDVITAVAQHVIDSADDDLMAAARRQYRDVRLGLRDG